MPSSILVNFISVTAGYDFFLTSALNQDIKQVIHVLTDCSRNLGEIQDIEMLEDL